MNPPSRLIRAFREGRGAVFAGAGASIAAGLPSWDELVNELVNQLAQEGVSIDLPQDGPLSPDQLLNIPQYYENKKNRRELIEQVEELFRQGTEEFRRTNPKLRRPIHHYLAHLPSKLYYTTNVDILFEEEFNRQGVEYDLVVDDDTLHQFPAPWRRCQVRKIHGSLTREWDDVVLTRSNFANAPHKHPDLYRALADDLKSHCFLFIGYSLRDPDFRFIYNNVFYVMGGKHQSHFLALLEDPGPCQTDDLQRQGVQLVKLWEYPGDSTEKTIAFLESLVAETSDRTHLRRFYRGLQRYDQVPIVITSSIHETEGYVYYPACDIHVANQIVEDLRKLGVSGNIVPDQSAIKDREGFLSDNVILVCSPFGNEFTRHVFERASAEDLIRSNLRSWRGLPRRGKLGVSDIPSPDHGREPHATCPPYHASPSVCTAY